MEEQEHTTCLSNADKQKLFTTLGYIKKGVEDNTDAIKKQNGSVADLTKRVNKHDVFLGKIGAVMATVTFFVSVGTATIIKFWKDL
ncbi:hypothetical protein LCGC14_2121050 [marine sediment metagenome]|uniref:Uncharacterized protein n=1 Tax=marine sediment metagenome TaxID=412755 RepID=A0A0F9E4B9_9ZZZZ